MRSFKWIKDFTRDVLRQWIDHKAPKMAAALSYYAVFSMAPILIVAVAVAQILFNREAVRNQVMLQLNSLFGSELSSAIEVIFNNVSHERSGFFATFMGLSALILGATGALTELQDSLNTIWNAPREKTSGWKAYFVRQFISLLGVLSMGLLLSATIVSSALLSSAHHWLSSEHILSRRSLVWAWVNASLSFAVLVLVFAMLFKFLPRVKVLWKDVWLGAFFATILFNLGKYCIGLYLSRAALHSTYGAAGSLVAILIWVYYAAQIFFFGAEITNVYAERRISKR